MNNLIVTGPTGRVTRVTLRRFLSAGTETNPTGLSRHHWGVYDSGLVVVFRHGYRHRGVNRGSQRDADDISTSCGPSGGGERSGALER